jgi:penicillin-insensitive murein DD-endopeptidase
MGLRRVVIVACAVPALAVAGFAAIVAWVGVDGKQPSVCRGTAAAGSLDGGRRLPNAGENYRAYSVTGVLLGRTFVHSAVRDAMRDAYAALHKDQPELRFVYAEGGWPWGGRFDPHKTHRNGTAVDFLVPVRTPDGKVAELSTTVFNQFGYGVDFDKSGRSGPYKIDFQAMALHLLALDRAARVHGIGIQRVIFDVDLQPLLLATGPGARLRDRISFNKTQSWVRHDEHYHVDFNVPCRG